MTRPITETMHHIGGGFFIDTASEKMQELVKQVDETNRQGKLELIITVKKTTRGGAMLVTGAVKLTLPKAEPMEAMLFATEDGALTQDNPKQQGLDLKSVPETDKTELKQINQKG